jgi:hypothetical protein
VLQSSRVQYHAVYPNANILSILHFNPTSIKSFSTQRDRDPTILQSGHSSGEISSTDDRYAFRPPRDILD